jgi:5-methylcytosine-specific restriction endonuclease McrA
MLLCSKCGVRIETYANGTKCRACYNEYMREYKIGYYRRRRDNYIAQLGGVCIECGTPDNLEFDHVDASQKLFDVSQIFNRSDAVIQEELTKCVLRCKIHHLEKTRELDLGAVEHGGGASGKKNCPCSPCKAKKAEYMAQYYLTHPRRPH